MALSVAIQNVVCEWSFASDEDLPLGAPEVQLDVLFEHENGMRWCVPMFQTDKRVWRVRFATSFIGTVKGHIQCELGSLNSLEGHHFEFIVQPGKSDNPLYRHGPIRVAEDRRHFAHEDGTPFFWLGDTWWTALSARLAWPHEFQSLVFDRLAKSFSVVQIVAGLYPDMAPLDKIGANEAGLPWDANYKRINPAYFDLADRRIQYLVDVGITPCIFGSWGYFAQFMSVDSLKQHWRELIARWGAYPIVWSLAGEAVLPYYLSKEWDDRANAIEQPRHVWSEVARYVRQIEPFGRLLTIHPPYYEEVEMTGSSQLDDRSLVDFDMLQTRHGGFDAGWFSVLNTRLARSVKPTMPVVQGEGFYEGIMDGGREEVQRWFFWSTMLEGAAGHTYGANGLWQLNKPGDPFRANPKGINWGDTPWQEAMQQPGSTQVGIGRRILEQFDWWKLEPHPEWVVSISENDDSSTPLSKQRRDTMRPYAGGVAREWRIIYMTTNGVLAFMQCLQELEADVQYIARWINPSNAETIAIGLVQQDEQGQWIPPQPPVMRDWLLVLEVEK